MNLGSKETLHSPVREETQGPSFLLKCPVGEVKGPSGSGYLLGKRCTFSAETESICFYEKAFSSFP